MFNDYTGGITHSGVQPYTDQPAAGVSGDAMTGGMQHEVDPFWDDCTMFPHDFFLFQSTGGNHPSLAPHNYIVQGQPQNQLEEYSGDEHFASFSPNSTPSPTRMPPNHPTSPSNPPPLIAPYPEAAISGQSALLQAAQLVPSSYQVTSQARAPPKWSCPSCVFCGRAHDRFSRARDCEYRCLGIKPYKCEGLCGDPACECAYSSKALLNEHLLPLSERYIRCPGCFQIISKKNIARHKRESCPQR
ncbi:hypothetical protein M408DRAFT_193257 [Serendipita vermifera MAFF 305830]|uniref:Uncharacterized protein n=1 Tax=Serendipita vermifera MAFF 305830 TaxID=933852 RepID=A0A0C3B2M0_SERVB|nr:hypothetical protein M408DRAFT_193257 [Serendipita vermifera MAFF 305830]